MRQYFGSDRALDYRDRAVNGILIYTAAREGAVAKLRLKDLIDEGQRLSFRFDEKGGKARTIPVNAIGEVFVGISEHSRGDGRNEGEPTVPDRRRAKARGV